MKRSSAFRNAVILVASLFLLTAESWAHCDTWTGPVVKAGRQALESRDIRYALIWVQPKDEPEIRSAFEKAVAVRALGRDAKSLADRYFFETLVRVHRAGEGAPFTGLKDEPVEPGIAAAEHALESNAVQDLSKELTDVLQRRLEESFQHVQATKSFKATDVEAGRRYVASYVSYIHYVERLHLTIESAGADHGTEEHVH